MICMDPPKVGDNHARYIGFRNSTNSSSKDDGAISADHPLILIQVQYNKEMVETKPAVFWSRLLKVLKYHL